VRLRGRVVRLLCHSLADWEGNGTACNSAFDCHKGNEYC
jgi:hypothetical protein